MFIFFHRIKCESGLVEENVVAALSEIRDLYKEVLSEADELLVSLQCTFSIRIKFTSKTVA